MIGCPTCKGYGWLPKYVPMVVPVPSTLKDSKRVWPVTVLRPVRLGCPVCYGRRVLR